MNDYEKLIFCLENGFNYDPVHYSGFYYKDWDPYEFIWHNLDEMILFLKEKS